MFEPETLECRSRALKTSIIA